MDTGEPNHDQSLLRRCQQCLVEPCAAGCQLAAVERRMRDSAQTTIMSLIAEQRKLKANSNDRNDLLGRLPVELAIQIFTLCIDQQTPSLRRNLSLSWKKPFHFVLGKVCHTWRHIVWSYPQFWKNIPIFLEESTTSPSQITILVQEWILRSGQLPLSIWIKSLHGYDATRIFDLLIPVLNSVAHRWRFFHAGMPSEYLEQLRLENEQRPLLKELILRPTDADDEEEYERDVLGINDGSSNGKLFDLGAEVFPEILQISSYQLQNIRLDRTNLTHLIGFNLPLNECVNIFEWAPQLVKCNLLSIIYTDIYIPSTKRVVNHTVKTFVIEDDDDDDEVFHYLTLPALQQLCCSSSRGSHLGLVLAEFIVRSGCKLEAATFRYSSGNDDLLQILQLIPSLKRLSLSEANIGHTFLARLGETSFVRNLDNSPHLLPHLQYFHYCFFRRFEWSSVAAMLPPIMPPPPDMVRRPLKSIHFEIYPKLAYLRPGAVGWPEKWEQLIDRKSLDKMLGSIDSGVDLRIIEEESNHDIIQISKTYHGIGVEEQRIDSSLFEFSIL